MKITDVKTLCLSRPHEPERRWRTGSACVPKADCAIVVVDTDEGIQGIGEACAYGVPPKIRDEVERIKPDLEQKAYSIVQADGGWCGLTEGIEIGRRAHEFGVPMCPHNWHNGLMTMANAHLVAALPDPRVLELNMVQGPLQWEILREKPVIEDGHLELPDRPGLGVELADDLEARFPYIEGSWAVRISR